MEFESEIWMKAKVDKEKVKNGLLYDAKYFDGMKPGDFKLADMDHIVSVDKDGTKAVYVVTGWHRFREKKYEYVHHECPKCHGNNAEYGECPDDSTVAFIYCHDCGHEDYEPL